MNKLTLLLLCFLLYLCSSQILNPNIIKPHMFTSSITGNLNAVQPSGYGISSYWPFPVEVYEISMMKYKHQFLPSAFPPTDVYAYAGKVNGQFKPSFPGPAIKTFKNMPIYVIWTNNIDGKHMLPVDTSPPFDMVSQFQNQVPVVPHAHGLQTEMGSDGQPMGFWTKTGRRGPDYFSLRYSSMKPNQAVYRYHNTKEGLLWYHDHSMAITRLNVYSGLAGFYQIIDPFISSEELNILNNYGDLQRKYFVISDRSFKTTGQLYYPNQAESSDFKYWVPEFFGNTIVVNGKVWPKVALKPQMYRFVFLNGCQSRFLNIYFEYKNTKLDFQIFRRDSDYLKTPVTVKEHLLVLGGRIQIFIDFSNLAGSVMLKNDAKTPYPMGNEPDQFTRNIMKINIGTFNSQPSSPSSPVSLVDLLKKSQNKTNVYTVGVSTNDEITPGQTLTQTISNRFNLYLSNRNQYKTSSTYQFLDQPQAPNYNSPSGSNQKTISLVDFINSNENSSASNLNNIIQSGAVQTSQKRAANSIVATNSQQQIIKNIQSQALSLTNLLQQINNNVTLSENTQSTAASTSQNAKFVNNQYQNFTITNIPFPRFGEGQPYFTILSDVKNDNDQMSGVMIDGVPIKMGCKGSEFREGSVYDFYIINLTMDDHPIHIHLINFQIIKRFKFNMGKFKNDWESLNGKLRPGGIGRIPTQIDVRNYKLPNSDEPPKDEEKLFSDTILSPAEMVTVARMKFANHQGKPFPFDIAGARYVWHCHILEHEDNQMMRYFCVV